MLYAMKLGTIETGDGSTNAYLGVRDDGQVVSALLEQTDNAALSKMAAAASGEKLYCETSLAPVGQQLGFEPASMFGWALEPRAAFAFMLARGRDAIADPNALRMLCQSAPAFLRARPWQYWTDNEPFEVVLDGARQARYEAVLMGAAGIEVGVAIYTKAGAVRRLARNFAAGRMNLAKLEDSLVVSFDTKPTFAIEALRDCYDLDLMPCPLKMRTGFPAPMEPEELALLASTLLLLGGVTPQQRKASISFGTADETTKVSIAMPEVRS